MNPVGESCSCSGYHPPVHADAPQFSPTRFPIRALPDLLVNQIAAGEVIERPASVVKELVDNAIDAGASRIVVELERGGVELVRVSDDGAGVPPEDARLMVAPHATSKLRSAEDLDAIATMGFRGEALASIVSVARVSIRSRPRPHPRPRNGSTPDADADADTRDADAVGAWRLDAEGDSIGDVRPESGPYGTSVSVRNLFFNTPARRKFLRTIPTEQTHCLAIVRDLSMSHPAIGFRAECDGRVMFDYPPESSPRARMLDVMGRELESQLLEASADESDGERGVSLWGLVGLPSLARATNKSLRVFLNGRPIRDKTVQHAIKEAYRGLIEPGRFPAAALLLETPPGAVDVNVHPTKAEVRFRDGSLVHSVVLRAVREALAGADLTPAYGAQWKFGAPGTPGTPGASAAAHGAPSPGAEEVLPGPAQHSAPGAVSTNPDAAKHFVDAFARPTPAHSPGRFDYDALRDAVARERGDHAHDATPPHDANRHDYAMPAPRPASRVMQVHNSFLVTQDEQGLVIIDQHALHERVMFEELLRRLAKGPLESQRMLTPAVVRTTPARVDVLETLRPTLERLGVEAGAMGPDSVGVHAFPTYLFDRGVDAGHFVEELLERAEDEGFPADTEEAVREILDMRACKAAIKAGDRLSDGEMETLLQMRDDVDRSSNCPHGRPTTIRLSIRDLEKRFGRG
ncbi:MAG: DNA mismatch repair endonuclease MutL [Phycisphaerales bacterium]|nr:MAG: DNA mismatch repair endonuclease MutL [Phycisphaerales bacterium]